MLAHNMLSLRCDALTGRVLAAEQVTSSETAVSALIRQQPEQGDKKSCPAQVVHLLLLFVLAAPKLYPFYILWGIALAAIFD
jgi:hypothetical protein